MAIMVETCDIWVKVFVIAFLLIAGSTFALLVVRFVVDIFLPGGNILYYNQQRKINILEDELRQYKDNN